MAQAYGSTPFLPIFPAPVAVAGYAALVFLLLAASAGWMTRLSLIGSTALYLYFIPLDMISTLNKYTVLSGHVMFLLSLSQCGSVWSVDAWLARRTGASASRPQGMAVAGANRRRCAGRGRTATPARSA